MREIALALHPLGPVAMVLALLTACRNVPAPQGGDAAEPERSASTPADASAGQPAPFPRWSARADRDLPDARLDGALVMEGGCLRVRPDGGGASFLIVWPPQARLEMDAGGPRVVDPATQGAARPGETIRLGGGEVAASAPVLRDLAAPLPAGCPGPIWLASGIVR